MKKVIGAWLVLLTLGVIGCGGPDNSVDVPTNPTPVPTAADVAGKRSMSPGGQNDAAANNPATPAVEREDRSEKRSLTIPK